MNTILMYKRIIGFWFFIIVIVTPIYSTSGETGILTQMLVFQLLEYAETIKEFEQQIKRFESITHLPQSVSTSYRNIESTITNDILDISNILVSDLTALSEEILYNPEKSPQDNFEILKTKIQRYDKTLQTARETLLSLHTGDSAQNKESIKDLFFEVGNSDSVLAQSQATNHSLWVMSNQLQGMMDVLLLSEQLRSAELASEYMKEKEREKREKEIVNTFWGSDSSYSSDKHMKHNLYD